MRIALEFAKKDAAKYISHLDLQRAFSRAIRRSGVPVKLSKGFNPHYTVSFASALALGIESECEIAELATERDVDPGRLLIAMKAALPPGLYAKRAAVINEKAAKLAASVYEAEYKAILRSGDLDKIKKAVYDIMDSKEITVNKKGKDIDIRSMISSMRLDGGCVEMRLAAAPSGSLRPDIIIWEIKDQAGDLSCRIVRTKLLTKKAGKSEGLFEAFTGTL
jgi:radical SAM-linked protein